MDDWTDLQRLPIYALAVWQAVETWRGGSIFMTTRQFVRDVVMTHRYWLVRKFGEGLSCPFCLPHWVAGLFAAYGVLHVELPSWLACLGWWAVYSLAVTRLAQVGNDVMKGTGWSQSPPSDVVVIDEVSFVNEPGAE